MVRINLLAPSPPPLMKLIFLIGLLLVALPLSFGASYNALAYKYTNCYNGCDASYCPSVSSARLRTVTPPPPSYPYTFASFAHLIASNHLALLFPPITSIPCTTPCTVLTHSLTHFPHSLPLLTSHSGLRPPLWDLSLVVGLH